MLVLGKLQRKHRSQRKFLRYIRFCPLHLIQENQLGIRLCMHHSLHINHDQQLLAFSKQPPIQKFYILIWQLVKTNRI